MIPGDVAIRVVLGPLISSSVLSAVCCRSRCGEFFIVVSTPILAFLTCVVEAHKPVSIQAFRPELAVEGLDECVVGRFSGSREVERDATLISPQISSQADTEKADMARERDELATQPEAELLELAAIYEQRGLSPDLGCPGYSRVDKLSHAD